MSQKTNPLSLRLQKTSRNFAYPWFADFFWRENYLKNFEIEKYITLFLKQTHYSKAFFLAKSFYRKSSILLFLYDTRLGKKKNQLLLKKKVLFSRSEKRPSNMIALLSQKTISNFFWIDSNILSSSVSHMPPANQEVTQRQSNIIKKKKLKPFFKKNCFSFLETSVFPSTLSLRSVCLSTRKKEKENKEKKKFLLPLAQPITSISQIENSQSKIYSLLKFKMPPKVVEKLKDNFVSNKTIIFNKELKLKSKVCSCVHKKISFSLPEVMLHKFKEKAFAPLCPHFFPTTFSFQPIRFIDDHQNVITLTDQIVDLLEKRITFRQIKYILFNNILQNSYIKGIRISCSGRLGGRSKKAQKAKLQSDSIGRTPLASFSSKISFCSKSAYTPYGKVGVKIWLSFNDNTY